jgi:hypothetical protein
MHGHTAQRLARLLAAVTIWAAGAAAWAQSYAPPTGPDNAGYTQAEPNFGGPRFQAPQPMQANVYPVAGSAGLPADDTAARLADLERQVQAMQDKETAAKAAAALVPSVKLGGRLQWDTNTFNQNTTSQKTAGDALNG